MPPSPPSCLPKMTDLRDQRGQAAPLMVAVLMFAALAALGVAQVGRGASQAARAQATADATALAGAAAGEQAAEEIAAANDASLERYEQAGDEVRVSIHQGPARASARARWNPTPIP